MRTAIVLLDGRAGQSQGLSGLLRQNGCPSESLATLDHLQQRMLRQDILAVIIDIDSVPLENRTLRDLAVQNPHIYFFCLSERRFHPELEDAIGSHFYACINKPIDPDELFFWIDSIRKEGHNA